MAIPNNSTGLWTGIWFGNSANYCAGVRDEVFISKNDRAILRQLAEKVASLASRKSEEEKRELWYKQNSLISERPLILTDLENGWNEVITEDVITCKSELARRWEVVLRKEIFWGESICDDRPIEAVFEIGYTRTDSEWGVDEKFHGGQNGSSYVWEPIINDIEEIDKIQIPKIEVDYKTTLETFSLANEVLGDILKVKMRGLNWHSPHMTWDMARLVGLQNMLLYMCNKPKLLHSVMKKLLEGNMAKLDFLEENNLLTLNNDNAYVGSGGIGYTRELPRRSLEGSAVKTEDLWLHDESQETTCVSPKMFEEFIFQYQLPLHQRFGLSCYGCCEPVDNRWHIVKNIPNLRRVSISAWANQKKMSEYLEDKYIYSRKPNPADLAIPTMDEDYVRKGIRETLEITKGCVLELVMKDNHTIGNNPNNIINWVKIAREEIDKRYH